MFVKRRSTAITMAALCLCGVKVSASAVKSEHPLLVSLSRHSDSAHTGSRRRLVTLAWQAHLEAMAELREWDPEILWAVAPDDNERHARRINSRRVGFAAKGGPNIARLTSKLTDQQIHERTKTTTLWKQGRKISVDVDGVGLRPGYIHEIFGNPAAYDGGYKVRYSLVGGRGGTFAEATHPWDSPLLKLRQPKRLSPERERRLTTLTEGGISSLGQLNSLWKSYSIWYNGQIEVVCVKQGIYDKHGRPVPAYRKLD